MRLSFADLPQFARNGKRLREIVTILGRYGLADWLSHLDWHFVNGLIRGSGGQKLASLTHEARVRLALTELGTTFIKFGQMLSTRPDLISPELAAELTLLQTNVPADPPAAVTATIEKELGRPIAELFAEFDPVPVASASIAQVHRAKLPDGRLVAVKVQHPGLTVRVRSDLSIMLGLAELAERHIRDAKLYRPVATAGEFRRSLLRELDFGRELRHLQQFVVNFARDPLVRFPVPHPCLSTSRVLTMDWVDGRPVSEGEQLRTAGLDLDDLARRGATLFLDMIFRDGFYHADPHPGNIRVLPDGIIALLDAGMVGRLDETLRDDIETILLALLGNDPIRLADTICRIGRVPPGLDPSALGADVADFLDYYRGRPLEQLDLSAALTEMTEIVRRYHILLPTGVALLLKVLVMLEGTGRLLNPRFSLAEALQPYRHRLMMRRLSPARQARRLRRYLAEWESLSAQLPGHLADLFRQVRQGHFAVQLRHERLEPSVNRLVRGLLTSALFVGSALLWALRAPPTVWGVSVSGVLGCVAGIVMGLGLIGSIRRSERPPRDL